LEITATQPKPRTDWAHLEHTF